MAGVALDDATSAVMEPVRSLAIRLRGAVPKLID
jgi:hypothetical protein